MKYTLITVAICLLTLTLHCQQLEIQVNDPIAGFKMQNSLNNSSAWIDLLNNNDKLLQIGITGSINPFFGTANTAYLFTPTDTDVPIVFAPGGNEILRLDSKGIIKIGEGIDGNPIYNSLDEGLIDIKTEGLLPGLSIRQDSGNAAINIYATGKFTKGAFISSDSTAALDLRSNAKESQSALSVRASRADNTINVISANNDGDGIAILGRSHGDGIAGQFTNQSATNPTLDLTNFDANGQALYILGLAVRADAQTNWDVASDERLKKNIQPFDDGLHTILQIKPKTFNYNGLCGTNPDIHGIGIIAQEIEQVAPYTITKSTKPINPDIDNSELMEDVRQFNPSALTYVMINAIKELNQKVDEKDKLIHQQSEEIRELKERMTQIENIILTLNHSDD